MSAERDLITKILQDQDLATVVDHGITPNFFQKFEHKAAFEFIIEHHSQYSKVPSIEAFHRNFDPTYRLADTEEPLRYYIDQVTLDYDYFLLERGLSEAVDLFEDGDYSKSKEEIAKTLMHINREIASAKTVDITQTGSKRLERYKEYAKSKGALKGISSGFPAIDRATNGFQPGQLIIFVGPPKAGKSTILLLSAIAANRGFYKPYFAGFEMSNEEQEERHDALRAGVDAKALREGRLPAEDMRRVEKMQRYLELMPEMYFSEDTSSTMTVSGLTAQVEKYDPDIVFVDGVYMMEDENGEKKNSPQALTNITRSLKKLAQNKHICVAISTQVLEWKMSRKAGITSSSIGYSSSFSQDADCIIGVENTDEPDVKKIKIILSRNSPPFEILVRWDWTTGEFEELEDEEEYEDAASAKF